MLLNCTALCEKRFPNFIQKNVCPFLNLKVSVFNFKFLADLKKSKNIESQNLKHIEIENEILDVSEVERENFREPKM